MNKKKLIEFFKKENKHWAELAEGQGFLAAAGNTQAALICSEIAEEISNGKTNRAKIYLNGLKENEPHRAEEADEMLSLL